MNAQRRETLARQLETLSERVNHATRMVEEGANYVDILQRLQQIRAELGDAKTKLLEVYLERWADALTQGNNLDQCKDLLEEFPVLFNSAGKINLAVINHQKGEKNMTTVNYFIPSINCGNCKRKIETWLSQMNGVLSVQVNVPTKQAVITFDAPTTNESLKAFLARVNYPVQEDVAPVQASSCCG